MADFFEDPAAFGAALPMSQSAPAAPAPGGASNLDHFRKILQFALPAIATAYALKKGSGLGEYATGMLKGDQAAFEQRDHLEQRALQREGINRQIAYQNAQEARQHRIEAAAIDRDVEERQRLQAAAEAAKAKAVHDALSRALDKAAENPAFMEKVNKGGPENFALTVQGVGNVNLKDAFDQLGVIKGPDGYEYGHAPAPAPRKPLVTGYGPDGKTPTRVEDAPGVRTYERPRAPKEGKQPTKRAYTWKDDDPESETFGKSFRIVEDDNGKEISKTLITGKVAPSLTPPKTNSNDPLGIRGK